MSLYVKLETRILTDSKIIAAGPDGFALWAKGLCYSKEHLTDGFIPSHALAVLGIGMRNVSATVRKLCVVGLWSECENGFTVGAENWADHQTTKAEVNANRESARLRKRRSRAGHTVTQDHVTEMSQGCHANVTQPEHRVQSTEPEHKAQSTKKTSIDTEDSWKAFRSEYPKKDGDLGVTKGRQIFDRLLKSGVTLDALLTGARAYRKWCDDHNKTATEFVKAIPSWLNQKCWESSYGTSIKDEDILYGGEF